MVHKQECTQQAGTSCMVDNLHGVQNFCRSSYPQKLLNFSYIYNLVIRVVCHENINPLNSLNFSNHENLNPQKQPTIWYVCTIYHNYILLQFICHGKVAQMDEAIFNLSKQLMETVEEWESLICTCIPAYWQIKQEAMSTNTSDHYVSFYKGGDEVEWAMFLGIFQQYVCCLSGTIKLFTV